MSLASRKADWLAGLDAGVVSLADVLEAAATDEAAAALWLSHALAAARVPSPKAVMARARRYHGGNLDPTLGWLADPRARGRTAALAHALDHRPPVWEGFPITPAPREWRKP